VQKLERDLLRDRDKGSLVARAQTLAEYADRYLTSRKAEVSAQTLSGYRNVVDRYIKPYPIGSLRLDAVDRAARSPRARAGRRLGPVKRS